MIYLKNKQNIKNHRFVQDLFNKEKTTNKKNEEIEKISTIKVKKPKYFYDLIEKYKNLINNLIKTVKEVYFSKNDKNRSPFSSLTMP